MINIFNQILYLNQSILKLFTFQKINLDKIDELEKSNVKLEQNAITNESKLKQISWEIENLKFKRKIW